MDSKRKCSKGLLNILNYKRNQSVTSRGNYGNQDYEMKIHLYHIPLQSVLHHFFDYVTVLLKTVRAIRQCSDKGSFLKMTSFSLENNISFSSKSVHLSKIRPKTDMTLSCSNNCLIARSNQKHVTPYNVLENPRPFLMESNLKLWKIPMLHSKRSRMRRRAHPSYIVLRSGLTKLTRFVLASAHT